MSHLKNYISAVITLVALLICVSELKAQTCGNNIREGTEECDGADADAFSCQAGCSENCICVPFCGDSVVDPGEECDGLNDFRCPVIGGIRTCCIPAGIHACECENLATGLCGGFSICGNGILERDEACDDGNSNDIDSCKNNCTLNLCGNGVRNSTEQCDDGNTISRDGCSSTCRREFCGDGSVNNNRIPGTEVCDFAQDPLFISLICRFNKSGCSRPFLPFNSGCKCAICGNGIVAGDDECDEGAKCDDGTACVICDLDNDPTGSSCITDPCTGSPFDSEDPSRCRERESAICTEDCMLKCDSDHKSMVCHNESKILCIDNHAVDAHLNHGDTEVEVDQKDVCPPRQQPQIPEGEQDEVGNEGTIEEPGEEEPAELPVEPTQEGEEEANGAPASDSQESEASSVTGGCSLMKR